VISEADLTASAIKLLNDQLADRRDQVDDSELKLRVGTPGVKIRYIDTGEVISADKANVTLRFRIKHDHVPFRLVRYSENSDKEIAEAAVADIVLAGTEAQVMIIQANDDGGRVILIPRKNEPSENKN
jgi:hypothetical protein